MSSVHSDKGWVFVSFMVAHDDRKVRVRLYPGIRATREGLRSPVIKEIEGLILLRRYDEILRRYPNCKALEPFRELPPPRRVTRREMDHSVDVRPLRSYREVKTLAGGVYFLRCGEFIKIGYSTHWPNRLRGLQTGNPNPTELLLFVPGERSLEPIESCII